MQSLPNVIEMDSLLKHVQYLTNTPEPRNFRNLESLNKAATYIKAKFRSYGYNVEEQNFNVEQNDYKNVIACFKNPNCPKIVIGAHYDVCGDQPGADDNASGVAGLLEIARIIKQSEVKINYEIEFVAYSLEEPPFFATENMGSFYHAQKLHRNKKKIELMICLEMIGYFSEEENSQKYPIGIFSWFYPDKGNFIAAISNISSKYYANSYKRAVKSTTDLECVSFSAPSFLIPGLDYSDHRNYWHFGYKAIMLTDTAFLRNKNYHELEDTIDKLDFRKMSMVISGVLNMIINEVI
jgi:Zn-dependent M28 family amino/carboxypeptidase